MRFAGMPWRADVHERLLEELLGPRPQAGERPAKVEALLARVRGLLEVPELNPDSPAELLKGLARGGVLATSTRSWELRKIDHPAIAPLLEYKKLSRLASANGWNWLDSWVADGRFRPDYVVGGVVTGRWATSGGGALQLPKQVRAAAVADAGWKLVVADAAQLEPRILAAMAGDRDMVEAGAAGDLYAGIVARGAINTREHAKVALLGAMYGATQGDGGRLMPQLARAYPKAIGMVEDAARAGERGEIVTTRLGRSSPPPGATWRDLQQAAYGEEGSLAAAERARSYARSWGRFTRNFIVQGTAAEWALCWMASLRNRLTALEPGSWFTTAPHLVFFLHDELVVHTPQEHADRVAEEIRAAAQDAGRLLFGALPVDFPLTVATVDNYGQAK
jgi:DNA polymerase-1